jgi:hypothetical protein
MSTISLCDFYDKLICLFGKYSKQIFDSKYVIINNYKQHGMEINFEVLKTHELFKDVEGNNLTDLMKNFISSFYIDLETDEEWEYIRIRYKIKKLINNMPIISIILTLKDIEDRYKTREFCIKEVVRDPSMIQYCPKEFITKEFILDCPKYEILNYVKDLFDKKTLEEFDIAIFYKSFRNSLREWKSQRYDSVRVALPMTREEWEHYYHWHSNIYKFIPESLDKEQYYDILKNICLYNTHISFKGLFQSIKPEYLDKEQYYELCKIALNKTKYRITYYAGRKDKPVFEYFKPEYLDKLQYYKLKFINMF